MKTYVRNIIQVVTQSIVFLLAFLPGMYTRVIYAVSFLGIEVVDRTSYSLIHRANTNSWWLGYVLQICMLVGVVIYIIQVIAGDKMKLPVLSAIIAPAELVSFVLFSVLFAEGHISRINGYSYIYSYENEFLFLIMTALLIALALISVTGYVRGVKQRKTCAASKEETCKAGADDITQ